MALFPERLKALRNNFGLSQQKLADIIGNISKSSINMYERGSREPSFETMEAFADFFMSILIIFTENQTPLIARRLFSPLIFLLSPSLPMSVSWCLHIVNTRKCKPRLTPFCICLTKIL